MYNKNYINQHRSPQMAFDESSQKQRIFTYSLLLTIVIHETITRTPYRLQLLIL